MVLLALLATAGLLHGFVYRRRAYLWLFGGCLALMLYTQGSAILYWLGAAVRWSGSCGARCQTGASGSCATRRCASAARRCLFLPWLPTTIDQIAHATNPWHYTPLMGATVPSQLLGSERVDVTLLVCVVIARRSAVRPARAAGRRDAAVFWALIAIPAVALAVGADRAGSSSPSGRGATSRRSSRRCCCSGALVARRGRGWSGVAAIVFCVALPGQRRVRSRRRTRAT